VRLACEQNDQWAVIPEAAASIQPLTPQQQQALAGIPQYGANTQSPVERRRQERAKRLEDALNSSSVALDFSQPSSAAVAPQHQQETPLAAAPVAENAAEQKPKYAWDAYSGPLYRVFEGTVIETVLTNRLNGEFTGPVNVMVTTDLWSHDHQHILMPQGTRILGEAQKVSIEQQRRLAVVFHRAIMPDGYSVDFDKFAGLDQQGATGLTGQVNTHWAKVISTAVLVGAIGGLSQGFGYSGAYGPGTVITTGIGAQTGQQATQILDRALNVLPSVTVYEGTRVRLWTATEVELPGYENHQVNPSF
jgi:type IV secretory pathway VirB10-like protein